MIQWLTFSVMDQSGSVMHLENQRCIFPVSKRKSNEHYSYGHVKVLTNGDLPPKQEKTPTELNGALQIAWAIVLRFYTVNEIVSFAVISESHDHWSNGKLTRWRIHPKRMVNIVSYDVPDRARLCDVDIASSKSWERTDWVDGQVNTAIHFLQFHFPQSSGENVPKGLHDETLVDEHILSSIAVLCPQTHIKTDY